MFYNKFSRKKLTMIEVIKLFGLSLGALALLLVLRNYRKIIQLYNELGASDISYVRLKATLKVEHCLIEMSYLYGFSLKTKIPLTGYLSLEKKFLGKGVNTFFDDPYWAKVILENSRLSSLFGHKAKFPHLSSVEILGDKLKLTFSSRKIDPTLKDELKRAIARLPEVVKSLEGLPSSKIGLKKERIRNWLLYYLPLGVFIILSAVGLYWLSLGYDHALCKDGLLILGFKVLTPIFLIHFLTTCLILGKNVNLKKHLFILLVLYFAGYYLIPLTVLEPFNARFDQSKPKRIETTIKSKYISYSKYNRGSYLVLDNLPCPFRVSEKLYNRAKIGDKMVLYVKDGALGLPWAYRYWMVEDGKDFKE